MATGNVSPSRPAPRPPARAASRPASGAPAARKPRSPSPWPRRLLLLVVAVVLAILFWRLLVPPRSVTPPPSLREEFARRQTQAERNLVYAGLPKFTGPGDPPVLLRNQAYTVGYSETRENPLWVGYRLDRVLSPPHYKRPSAFKTDRRTRALVNTREYARTGFDRGHLAPSFGIGSRFGPEAQVETFLMSNIVPQKPDLNRKLWERLEELEVGFADRFGQVWVFTGPVFDNRRQILEGGVEIPDFLYKIIIDEDGERLRLLSFLIPQDVRGNEPLVRFLTTVDEVEKITTLDFLWSLSDPNEDRLEAWKPTALW